MIIANASKKLVDISLLRSQIYFCLMKAFLPTAWIVLLHKRKYLLSKKKLKCPWYFYDIFKISVYLILIFVNLSFIFYGYMIHNHILYNNSIVAAD